VAKEMLYNVVSNNTGNEESKSDDESAQQKILQAVRDAVPTIWLGAARGALCNGVNFPEPIPRL
jgi:hypothetical protein